MRLPGCVLLCALALPPAAAGQEAPFLTLEAAVEQALDRAPQVAASRAGESRAAAAVDEARSPWWPRLSIDAALQRFEEPMIVAPLHAIDPTRPPVFDETLIQGGLTLGYTLLDGGQRRGRVAQAVAVASGTEARTAGTIQAVVVATVEAYSRVLVARELLDVQAARLRALHAEADRVRRFLAAGRAARVELLRVDAALAGAGGDSVRAAAGLTVAEADLARLIGTDADDLGARGLQPIRLVAAAAPQASREALARNPDVIAARHQVEAAGAALKAARGEWLPTLRVEGRTMTYGSGEGTYTTEWLAGLRVVYPLFTGGGRRAQVAGARAAAAQADAEAREVHDAVEQRFVQAGASLRDAQGRLAAFEAAVAHLREVARIEGLALEQGAGTQSEYLRAEAELAAARSELARARGDVVVGRVELERLGGRLLPDRLALIVESEP